MTETHADYRLSQLDQLEAESMHIFREVAAEFEKPVLMFSGGKDSIVMLRLAERAFYPAKIPFPVLQVDTGYDFPEVLACRDSWVNRLGVRLVVASVEEAIKTGVVVDDGKTSRNRLQIGTLLNVIEGEPVAMSLPETVVLEVTEADPVVKGQTASSSYKPAVLSNGVKTMVPPFITAGEKIVVRTEDGSYLERAKG